MYGGTFIYSRESSVARSKIYHTLTSLIKNYITGLVGQCLWLFSIVVNPTTKRNLVMKGFI